MSLCAGSFWAKCTDAFDEQNIFLQKKRKARDLGQPWAKFYGKIVAFLFILSESRKGAYANTDAQVHADNVRVRRVRAAYGV